MIKNSRNEWTVRTLLAMVCASYFCAWSLSAAVHATKGGGDQLQLQELRLAREAAEKRVAQLDAAAAKVRKELQGLRSRYAELYLRSQDGNRRLEELELQAGHLLVDRQALATGRMAAEALRALEETRRSQVALTNRIRAFQAYLSSVLDVLEPSEALRREITVRYAEVISSAERALKPLSRVAGRGKRDLKARVCRVLAVNDDLQVVVLDSGYADGIRPGSHWHIARGKEMIARLRVIDVRADISAAVVTDGRLGDVGPGSEVAAD